MKLLSLIGLLALSLPVHSELPGELTKETREEVISQIKQALKTYQNGHSENPGQEEFHPGYWWPAYQKLSVLPQNEQGCTIEGDDVLELVEFKAAEPTVLFKVVRKEFDEKGRKLKLRAGACPKGTEVKVSQGFFLNMRTTFNNRFKKAVEQMMGSHK